MSEKNIITVERLPDGKVVQIMPDGTKRLLEDQTDWARLRAMTGGRKLKREHCQIQITHL